MRFNLSEVEQERSLTVFLVRAYTATWPKLPFGEHNFIIFCGCVKLWSCLMLSGTSMLVLRSSNFHTLRTIHIMLQTVRYDAAHNFHKIFQLSITLCKVRARTVHLVVKNVRKPSFPVRSKLFFDSFFWCFQRV